MVTVPATVSAAVTIAGVVLFIFDINVSAVNRAGIAAASRALILSPWLFGLSHDGSVRSLRQPKESGLSRKFHVAVTQLSAFRNRPVGWATTSARSEWPAEQTALVEVKRGTGLRQLEHILDEISSVEARGPKCRRKCRVDVAGQERQFSN
jgi:hypothetical protein